MLGSTLACLSLIAGVSAQPADDPFGHTGWASREAPVLADHVRLTSPDRFAKAGEAYFSPDAARVIFQAIERPPEGERPDQNYAMYVADIARDGAGSITGLANITRLSRPGAATTCGWFHPTRPGVVLFGSTMGPPVIEDKPGYQRGTSRYAWSFPREMELVSVALPDDLGAGRVPDAEPIFERDGYDAEGSWSPDGRWILYTHAEPPEGEEKPDGNLWVYDTQTGAHTLLIDAEGYDGGPFFSPDGARIIYRSDRQGDNLLQLFESILEFDDSGAIVGVEREIPLTANEHVNWCPFFDPSGSIAVYATSSLGHMNYEVFAIDVGVDTEREPDERTSVRVTDAGGFDGLPVISADAEWMMWTSQRAPEGVEAADHEPTSQVWAARIDLQALRARMFEEAMRRAAERSRRDG